MIFGNKFTRKELEVMILDNTTDIDDLVENLRALEAYLGIEYKKGEYTKIKKKTKRATKSTKTKKD